MSTEYKTRYIEQPKSDLLSTSHKLVGPKEASGFIVNNDGQDVVTGVAGERWLYNNRPTGTTNYKDKFIPFVYAKVTSFYF
jgi:hypothetical protein